MRITESQLRAIVRQELLKVLNENELNEISGLKKLAAGAMLAGQLAFGGGQAQAAQPSTQQTAQVSQEEGVAQKEISAGEFIKLTKQEQTSLNQDFIQPLQRSGFTISATPIDGGKDYQITITKSGKSFSFKNSEWTVSHWERVAGPTKGSTKSKYVHGTSGQVKLKLLNDPEFRKEQIKDILEAADTAKNIREFMGALKAMGAISVGLLCLYAVALATATIADKVSPKKGR